MIEQDDIQYIPLNQLVSHYLLSAYCFYIEQERAMTDHAWDLLSARLENNFDAVKHPDKGVIDWVGYEPYEYLIPPIHYPEWVHSGWRTYLRFALSGALMDEIRSIPKTTVVRRRRPPVPAKTAPATNVIRRIRRG